MKMVLSDSEKTDLPALMMKPPCRGFTSPLRARTGFTLFEVLLAASILAFCLCGLLLTYANMFILTDLSRHFTLATNAIQEKMEEIKKTNFDCLDVSSCLGCVCSDLPLCQDRPSFRNGCTFDINGFASSDAKGVVYITSDTGIADLKRAHIEASFKSRNRVIGGDRDLDGIADSGEDINHNELNSPVEAVTLVAK